MALKGFISIAEFDILELIGGGAYGRVFKAKRKNEKETFAIKCIKLSNDDDVELVYSSMRELTEMRRLHHPNIVQYYCGWWETLPPSWRRNSKQDQVDVSWSSQSDDFSSEAEISIDYEKRMKMEDERWGNVSDSSLSYQLALSAKSDGSATRRDDEVQREWLQHKRLTSQETSELKCRSNKTYLYLYIKMELCRKENLADWLKTPISQRVQLDVNNMFQSILQAVHYLHNQNIIHRDLKPSNIFFNSEWSIKIGDFGLSKGMTMEQALLTSDVNYGQTRSGTGTSRMNHTVYVGTKPYMAPEQEKCQTYNHKVDVYALAIILFELLIPFGSASERLIAISNLKVYQLPPKFEEIYGTKFKRLLIKMVSENPDIRPEIKNILSEYNIIALDLNISEQIDHYFSLIPRRLQREDIDLHPPQIRRMQYSDSKKRIVSTVGAISVKFSTGSTKNSTMPTYGQQYEGKFT
ncbi:hypothetical protein OUZ56_020110 [Daphnia magna]|uniref:Protein kinase domain-containing protein n=1 Tax=Daphnia magna TaxID=35525 RepID=A0ABQ9ZEL4_9CRUS|nr:hypothetical protein OUZ56_020110 [Daphnia magna]